MAFQGLLLLEYVVVLKRTEMCVFVVGLYARSPRIRLASWMSFGMMVTRLAWMAPQVGIIKQLDKVCLRHLLETQYCR